MRSLFPLAAVLFLSACGGGGQEGDECEVTADCADGLECHMHDDVGECHAEHGDDHDDHDDTDHGDDTDHEHDE